MQRIRKILAAIDCSGQSRCAERRAIMLSAALQSHVLEFMAVQKAGVGMLPGQGVTRPGGADVAAVSALEEQIQEQIPLAIAGAARQKGGPACFRSLKFGQSASAIVIRAEEIMADLIVVPGPGSEPCSEVFAHPAARELIRASARPLLFVNSDPARAYARVLVAVDFSRASREAACLALRISENAHVTFLHVVDPRGGRAPSGSIPASRQWSCEAARAELNRMIAEFRPRRIISRVVRQGNRIPALLEHIGQTQADLVVLGREWRESNGNASEDSVTERLLVAAPSDILIAPLVQDDGWGRPAA